VAESKVTKGNFNKLEKITECPKLTKNKTIKQKPNKNETLNLSSKDNTTDKNHNNILKYPNKKIIKTAMAEQTVDNKLKNFISENFTNYEVNEDDKNEIININTIIPLLNKNVAYRTQLYKKKKPAKSINDFIHDINKILDDKCDKRKRKNTDKEMERNVKEADFDTNETLGENLIISYKEIQNNQLPNKTRGEEKQFNNSEEISFPSFFNDAAPKNNTTSESKNIANQTNINENSTLNEHGLLKKAKTLSLKVNTKFKLTEKVTPKSAEIFEAKYLSFEPQADEIKTPANKRQINESRYNLVEDKTNKSTSDFVNYLFELSKEEQEKSLNNKLSKFLII
jgi:hypothetical protein